MTTSSVMNFERNSIEKMKKYQLPNYFKKIGIGIAVLSFLGLFVNKYMPNSEIMRIAFRYGMLLGMLIISISKEIIEDEFITKLRMQSYSFAFIISVVYALVFPFINYFVDSVLDGEVPLFKENGDFLILWFLLSIQVFYFEILKRAYK